MHLQGAIDEVMCRAFVMTLSRGTRVWYHNQPSDSISDFNYLRQAFTQQLLVSKNTKRIMASLLYIEQKQTFLNRLNESRLQIENFLTNILLPALVNDILHNHLKLSMQANFPGQAPQVIT